MHVRSEYPGNSKLRMERRSEVDMLQFSMPMTDHQNAIKEGTSRRKKSESIDLSLWRKQPLLPPGQMMTAKVKGLLKGLRYISQIFAEPVEKEPEMQIGYPTDVKHVAHIGCDGPSVSNPAWMNEFRSVPDFSTTPLTTLEALTAKDAAAHPPASRDRRPPTDAAATMKPPRRHHSHTASEPQSGEDPPARRRESRRNQSCGDNPDAPRRSRRQQGSAGSGGDKSPKKDAGAEGGAGDKPRRRRSKMGGSGSRTPDPIVSDAEVVTGLSAVSVGRPVDDCLRIENIINN